MSGDSVLLTPPPEPTRPSRRARPPAVEPAPEPAPRWRLPRASLRIGEPALETALRMASQLLGRPVEAHQLTFAHAAHHRLGGEEQMSLYFTVEATATASATATAPATAAAPAPAGAGAAAGSGAGAGPGARWRVLADLADALDPLDHSAIDCLERAEPYSEPGWHPVRPPSPSRLSPLQSLSAP